MHYHEIFHVVLTHTTVTFLTMDEALAFCKDMPLKDMVLCHSRVSPEEWHRIVDYIKKQTIKRR